MKKVITTISVYEIVMIFILSYENVCNSILCMFSRYGHCDFCEYHGFQYLVMCLLIPIIFALIWWWRDEIKSKIRQINKKTQDNYLSTEKSSTAIQSNKNANISKSDDTDSEKNQEDEKEYGWQYWD